VLSEEDLDAIAATNPADTGGVAALYLARFPVAGASARLTAAVASVQQQLDGEAHREASTAVQGSGSREGKLLERRYRPVEAGLAPAVGEQREASAPLPASSPRTMARLTREPVVERV